MRAILRIVMWTLAGIVAIGVLLTLYEPSLLVKLLRGMNLTVGIQDLVIWAAFLIGAIIVLTALIGSFSKSGKEGK
ncbi:hypothetical protein [Asticcacaulis sp. YBE204]|uniref:hypothetical protein n=1 Tax=Asticcacaulis sp. YBE204 TaxID=1282363 RepID=UPI0003C3F8F1|nr:hypothetical protein [Asticcacaulis sp. YBE204]ESQ80043.1 hypothetical protein AEYBE204_05340 [Asticcacaulis sp. YBE204]